MSVAVANCFKYFIAVFIYNVHMYVCKFFVLICGCMYFYNFHSDFRFLFRFLQKYTHTHTKSHSALQISFNLYADLLSYSLSQRRCQRRVALLKLFRCLLQITNVGGNFSQAFSFFSVQLCLPTTKYFGYLKYL